MTTIDITAITKLKHADLWAAACKLGSQLALAEHLGITTSTLCSWANLKRCPRQSNLGEQRWAEIENKLYELTNKTMEELFPQALRDATAFLRSDKTTEQTKSIPTAALLAHAETTRERLEFHPEEMERSIDNADLKERLKSALKTLRYREREIIKLRYGLGDGHSFTLKEVAHIFKVTKERIRQIEAKAIRQLQRPARADELKGFLDADATAAEATERHDAAH